MTIDRRSFSFAAIGLWLAPRALAQDLPAQQAAQPQAPADPSGPELTARFDLRRDGRQAVLALAVTPTRGPLDVLTLRGSRPGPSVQAWLRTDAGEVELVEVLGPVDRREMMSRMGPRPTYVAVARGDALELGPWRFELPGDRTDADRVRVVVNVWTGDGGIELTAEDLPLGDKARV